MELSGKINRTISRERAVGADEENIPGISPISLD
jgi:hypothetical protein